MYPDGYIPPILTVDTVVLQLIDGALSVLLIKRANEPFKGRWALPGGYNAAGETTHEAMMRILQAKGGIPTDDLRYVEQLFTFDTVARDPRGHAVSVTYMGLGSDLEPLTTATTQQPTFFPIDNLPDLAYDHGQIIDYALERLRPKLSYTNIAYGLLPQEFTISELQAVYEAVLGHQLDKRNFRKRILSLHLIEETKNMRLAGAHRPARIYRFSHNQLQVFRDGLE